MFQAKDFEFKDPSYNKIKGANRFRRGYGNLSCVSRGCNLVKMQTKNINANSEYEYALAA